MEGELQDDGSRIVTTSTGKYEDGDDGTVDLDL
jgi:hypothetical protein